MQGPVLGMLGSIPGREVLRVVQGQATPPNKVVIRGLNTLAQEIETPRGHVPIDTSCSIH